MSAKDNLSPVEKIKTSSNGLRGTLKKVFWIISLVAIHEDDQNLIKFHGMYQQDDRDRREERVSKTRMAVFLYDPFASSWWFPLLLNNGLG